MGPVSRQCGWFGLSLSLNARARELVCCFFSRRVRALFHVSATTQHLARWCARTRHAELAARPATPLPAPLVRALRQRYGRRAAAPLEHAAPSPEPSPAPTSPQRAITPTACRFFCVQSTSDQPTGWTAPAASITPNGGFGGARAGRPLVRPSGGSVLPRRTGLDPALIQQAIFSCSKNNMAQHFDPS